MRSPKLKTIPGAKQDRDQPQDLSSSKPHFKIKLPQTDTLYMAYLALRLFAACMPGYIHPDEHFQSTEIMAGSVFHYDVDRPWEWKSVPPGPARTVVLPLLLVAFPMKILQMYSQLTGRNPSALVIFLVPRFATFAQSLLLDYTLCRIAQRHGLPTRTLLKVFMTSYVTLVFLMRPFTNTWLTLILALCLSISLRPTTTYQSTFTLSLLAALGFYTRADAAFFLLAPCVMYTFRSILQPTKAVSRFTHLSILVGTFLTVILVSVVVDSFYFGFLHLDRAVAPTFEEFMLLPLARMLQLRPQGKLVSTLWNLVVYNTDKEHLKIHGIHPRWLHICVNMPLLFGPLLVPLIISIKGLLIGSERRSLLNMTNVCTLVGGLSLLSAVPHQEPRFLVPILTPLILLAVPVIHKMTPGQSKFFWSVWILFNVMMTIGLGVVHQGGVIPSLLYLDHHELGVVTGCVPTSTDATSLQCDIGPNQGLEQGTDSHRQFQTRIIYRKLFTPPKHLLGLRNRTVTDHHDIDFIHIAGHPASAIPYFAESMSLPVLDSVSQKRHAKTAHFALNSDGVYQRMLLVTPIYTLHDITPVLSAEDLTLVERWRWPLHFNFDDIGLIGAELAKGHFEALAVGVYEVVNTHQG